MNKDYIIDDGDGFNWVTLSKPLSEYTQEELAEYLVDTSKIFGKKQEVRLSGRKGIILNTDMCETKEDFLEKYKDILDAAGFKKEKVETKEEPKVETKTVKKEKKPEIKIITLPFGMMTYTQEDLAHMVMDNKLDGEEVGIKLPSGAILDSIGCKTVEDFVKKNESVATKLGVKHNIEEQLKNINIDQSLRSTVVMPEIIENVKFDTKKEEPKEELVEEEVKIIGKPLSKASFMDYTQEELAHLIMDDKIKNKDNKEYGIYEHKDVLFSSVGCETIEDFINKYKDEFYKRRIKPEKKQEEVKPSNVSKMEELLRVDKKPEKKQEEIAPKEELVVETKTEEIVEPVIDTPKIEEIKLPEMEEKVDIPEIKEETRFANTMDTPIVPLLQDMIKYKNEKGKDVSVNYNGVELSTEDALNFNDMIVKYSGVILNIIENERKKILSSIEMQKARILFEIPRGNYYNGKEESEQPKLAIIKEKNNEYARIFAERDSIDFNDTKAVYEWLNRLVPYINTHALNLNLGINITTEQADKFLLKVMEEKGYNTNLIDPNNMNDNYRYGITNMLNELENYSFFISDYEDLPEEDKDLTSPKTNAMVEVKLLEQQIERGKHGIELIENNIKENTIRADVKKQELQEQIDLIDSRLIEKAPMDFDSRIETQEEKDAVNAYKIALTTKSLDELKKAISLIDSLPEYSKIKGELSAKAYELFDTNKETSNENMSNVDLFERNKYLDRIDAINEALNDDIERLEGKKEKLLTAISVKEASITGLNREYKLGDNFTYEEKEAEFDLGLEDEPVKEGLFDKIRNAFGKKQEEPEVVEIKEFTIEDSDFDLSVPDNEDSLNKFTAIKSIKKISKTLYEKITSINVKKVLKNAIDKLRMSKKAALVYASFAAIAVMTTVAVAKLGVSNADYSNLKGVTFEKLDDTNNLNSDATIAASVNQVLSEKDFEVADEKTTIDENSTKESETITDKQSEEDSMLTLNDAETSLSEASSDAIGHILDGTTSVYGSFDDANKEVNDISVDRLYTPSWETAVGGNYYKEEDGRRTEITPEEAEELYENGEQVVQMVENEGVPIGFINVSDSSSRTM